MDTFQFRGKTVEVYTDYIDTPGGVDDRKDWRIRYTDTDGLIIQYTIVGYPTDMPPQIQVNYTKQIIRPSNGQVQHSSKAAYYEKNLALFYKATIPATMWYGTWAAIQAVNGLIARLPEFEGNPEFPDQGYRVFKSDGTFYQPVTFDVNITQPDYDDQAATPAPNGQISITPVDGVGPFQYSLDGGPQQATGTFSDLAPGSYTLRVEDSGGTYRERVVQLANQFDLMMNE
jgi:hypothetical protein